MSAYSDEMSPGAQENMEEALAVSTLLLRFLLFLVYLSLGSQDEHVMPSLHQISPKPYDCVDSCVCSLPCCPYFMLTLEILSAVFWRIDRALLDHTNPSDRVIYLVHIAQWATVVLGIFQLTILLVACIRCTRLDLRCIPASAFCWFFPLVSLFGFSWV